MRQNQKLVKAAAAPKPVSDVITTAPEHQHGPVAPVAAPPPPALSQYPGSRTTGLAVGRLSSDGMTLAAPRSGAAPVKARDDETWLVNVAHQPACELQR